MGGRGSRTLAALGREATLPLAQGSSLGSAHFGESCLGSPCPSGQCQSCGYQQSPGEAHICCVRIHGIFEVSKLLLIHQIAVTILADPMLLGSKGKIGGKKAVPTCGSSGGGGLFPSRALHALRPVLPERALLRLVDWSTAAPELWE